MLSMYLVNSASDSATDFGELFWRIKNLAEFTSTIGSYIVEFGDEFGENKIE